MVWDKKFVFVRFPPKNSTQKARLLRIISFMFFVKDNQQDRHQYIRSFLTEKGAVIAVLLAAIDFEWSMRRAILSLGTSPTKDIKLDLANFSRKIEGSEELAGVDKKIVRQGYGRYAQLWSKYVEPRLHKRIDEIIPHWGRLKNTKNGSARLRGQIVHGAKVAVSLRYAEAHVNDWLMASTILEQVAKENDTSLYRRVVRRKKSA